MRIDELLQNRLYQNGAKMDDIASEGVMPSLQFEFDPTPELDSRK